MVPSAKFNRPLAEQVASLLHDIPHTAFSHVIDVVMQDKNHEYHDRFFEQVIINSEIPEILKKHKLSLNKVLAKSAYPLLNNNLPDISVDRWDTSCVMAIPMVCSRKKQSIFSSNRLRRRTRSFILLIREPHDNLPYSL